MTEEKNAKAFLKTKGYYTENLWCLDDVMQNYHCTEEEAYLVLHKAMTNEATIEQIFLAIDDMADYLSLRKKQD